jgi:hypothetical protein
MIKVSVRGVEQLQAFFKKIPVYTRKAAVLASAEYLMGDTNHGLKHYVSYKYVSRKAAYGKTFKSDKQRAYVMAKIRSGEIAPGSSHRSGALAAGWNYKLQGGGYGASVYNSVPYAGYVMGDGTQANQPRMVGWRMVADIVKTNIAGMMRAANQAVERALKGLRG